MAFACLRLVPNLQLFSIFQYFSIFFNIFHLVPNVELPTASRGTIWAKVGNHYRRQHGAPADKEGESESSLD